MIPTSYHGENIIYKKWACNFKTFVEEEWHIVKHPPTLLQKFDKVLNVCLKFYFQ
jgi:hypothetical protein